MPKVTEKDLKECARRASRQLAHTDQIPASTRKKSQIMNLNYVHAFVVIVMTQMSLRE